MAFSIYSHITQCVSLATSAWNSLNALPAPPTDQAGDYQTRKHTQDVKDEERWAVNSLQSLVAELERNIEIWKDEAPVVPHPGPIGWAPISVLWALVEKFRLADQAGVVPEVKP